MCWTTVENYDGVNFGALNCDEAPSKERVDAYQVWLHREKDRIVPVSVEANSAYQELWE